MISDLSEQKAKIIFIIIVAVFIVVLLVVSYFIYFDTSDEDNTQKLNDRISEMNNIKTVIENNINNNKNNNNNNNKEETPVKQNEPLDNVKDNSYKDQKGKQVFNISNNIFSYNEAEAVCKSFNAELADEKQIKEAYEKGAEWCNYGWSKNQMALYPTQKDTWERLQKDPVNKNSCGMWGVNGGYFENSNTLFGVNCYGVKPEPKDRERNKLPSVSKREQEIQAKISSLQQNLDDITVLPFNQKLWSSK